MMPPHLTQAPVLTGDTLVLEGYTLDISNPAEELRVVDVETGEALAFDAEVSSVTEDRSGGTPDPPPGSIQSRCVLTARLRGVRRGARYRVTFDGDDHEVVAG